MHKTASEGVACARQILHNLELVSAQIGLAVPFTQLEAVAEALDSSEIWAGAQNMHDAKEGAFTGEISADMLLDAGAKFVLLGHSERRHIFGEDNAFINRKIKRALEAQLTPVVCIGETSDQRDRGVTADVLKEQLTASLADLTDDQIQPLVIAYEPVWAIGTGRTATAEQAQQEHAFCRKFISERWGSTAAETVRILYGGSVKLDNAAELMAQPDVDGLLIGGASLDPKVFSEIVNRIEQ